MRALFLIKLWDKATCYHFSTGINTDTFLEVFKAGRSSDRPDDPLTFHSDLQLFINLFVCKSDFSE